MAEVEYLQAALGPMLYGAVRLGWRHKVEQCHGGWRVTLTHPQITTPSSLAVYVQPVFRKAMILGLCGLVREAVNATPVHVIEERLFSEDGGESGRMMALASPYAG